MHRLLTSRAARGLLSLTLLGAVAQAGTARAGDLLLLQQLVPGNQSGTVFLMLDRGRISRATATRSGALEHTIEIRLATDPPETVTLRCNDEAITRQLLNTLRTSAESMLDVTGRCRL
jgi:hypothetical protein